MKKESKLRKGVFVVDVRNSPLWRAARHHCELEEMTLIAASDFVTPNALAKEISSHDADFLIFSWRQAFDDLITCKRSKRYLLELNPVIMLLIPDHLGLDLYPEIEFTRCESADVVLTTSRRLYRQYSTMNKCKQLGILHDMPNLTYLESMEKANLERNLNQVIWIGNSEWGQRQGMVDHKGLRRFVNGIIEKVSESKSEVVIRIIDSAQRRVPNETVLKEIAQSACLIVTSDSEGTCLPILEAVALGTPVVTFDIGIADEIFTGELAERFIADRQIESAANCVVKVLSDFESASLDSKIAWKEYQTQTSRDISHLLKGNFLRLGTWRSSPSHRNYFLKWILRWLRTRI